MQDINKIKQALNSDNLQFTITSDRTHEAIHFHTRIQMGGNYEQQVRSWNDKAQRWDWVGNIHEGRLVVRRRNAPNAHVADWFFNTALPKAERTGAISGIDFHDNGEY